MFQLVSPSCDNLCLLWSAFVPLFCTQLYKILFIPPNGSICYISDCYYVATFLHVSLSCYHFCPLCSAFVPRFGNIIHNLIINFHIVPFVTLVFNITLINQCSYIYSIYPLPYCGGIIYDSVICWWSMELYFTKGFLWNSMGHFWCKIFMNAMLWRQYTKACCLGVWRYINSSFPLTLPTFSTSWCWGLLSFGRSLVKKFKFLHAGSPTQPPHGFTLSFPLQSCLPCGFLIW